MACEGYPTKADALRFKENSDSETEFMESAAETFQTPEGQTKSTITGFDSRVSQAVSNAGGIDNGDYESSPQITQYNEYVVLDRSGTPTQWKAKPSTPLPYQTDFTTYPSPASDSNLQSYNSNSLQALSGLTDPSDLDGVMTRRFNDETAMIAFTGHAVGRKYFVNKVGLYEVKTISIPMTIANFELIESSVAIGSAVNNTTSGLSSYTENTSGYNNTAYGFKTLQFNTTGFDNLAVGVQSMRDNTSGNRNTAVGVDALAKNTVGDHNLALGQNALGFNTDGTYNTALGIDALEYGLHNNFNTAIGQYAGLNLDNSTGNTVCGYNVFQAATSGNNNCAYGKDALRDQDGPDANTALGAEAARDNTTGTNVTAVGFRAARSNTTGAKITAIGDQAAFKNIDGSNNLAVGFTALYNNVSGAYNTAIGDNSLFSAVGGSNTAIGGFSGYNVTSGTENTFIGYQSGFTGSQKVDAVNTTAIGRGAFTTEDNTVQLGNSAVIGIGVGQNKIYWLPAIPVTGAWARGSVVYNTSVVAGGVFGWMCVTAGTPGTWKSMGNVAP